jgi:glycogen debranching enzyme
MADLHTETQFYIPARSSLDPEATTRLKHDETFAVFHSSGDLLHFDGNTDGVYHRGTRHLSHLELRLESTRLLVLSSAMQTDNAALVVDLTNPDFFEDGKVSLARDTIHIQRLKFLWKGAVYERLVIRNYADVPRRVELGFSFGADFADLFEARGQARPQRGRLAPARVGEKVVTLSYHGLDEVERRTRISFWPRPDRLEAAGAVLACDIPAGGQHVIMLSIDCEPDDIAPPFDPATFLTAMIASRRALAKALRRSPAVTSSSDLFNEMFARSRADLAMLLTDTPYGPYPYAGIPWFSTYFGRDALITALFTTWFDPEIARGVLGFLAASQATEIDAFQDAEPGKILHEVRRGEMAALREIPFGLYYGSIDSTPLFVLLAGHYLERTHDIDLVRRLWPSIEAALGWIESYGDLDGDGFVEYARRSDTGLQNQGWKDSHDSISHEDGALADGPIALCEVQAYVYGAWLAAASIAAALGKPQAASFERKASTLRERFDEAYWLADLGTYALALDGAKRPCRVSTSNAGHVLLTGLALPQRAEVVARTLMSPQMFSGWGIRTLSTGAARYNPMSYHNGSVWPHDNGVIALGFARYGLTHQVVRIFDGLVEAARYLPLQRLPELFCGFAQKRRVGPTGYPVACAPQAWAAATPIALLSASLGLRALASPLDLSLSSPVLPRFLDRVSVQKLSIGDAVFDIQADRVNSAVRQRDARHQEGRAA